MKKYNVTVNDIGEFLKHLEIENIDAKAIEKYFDTQLGSYEEFVKMHNYKAIDGGEYDYSVPKEKDTPEARGDYLKYIAEKKKHGFIK